MQSTRDVTIRVQYVNKLHGYLNSRDNGKYLLAGLAMVWLMIPPPQQRIIFSEIDFCIDSIYDFF